MFLQKGTTLTKDKEQAGEPKLISVTSVHENVPEMQTHVRFTLIGRASKQRCASLIAVACVHPAVSVILFFTDHVFITEIRVMSSCCSVSWVIEALQVHEISWEPAMLWGVGSMTTASVGPFVKLS